MMLTMDYFMIGLLLLLSPQIVRNFTELFNVIADGVREIARVFKK